MVDSGDEMMKNKNLVVGFSLFCLCMVSCTKQSSVSEHLSIATSVFPVYDITKNIGGDKIEVLFVVPKGANPHTYEPVPSVVRRIQEADLFIGVHPEFDGWIKTHLSSKTNSVFLKQEDHNDEHHHDNPHVWLSVRNAISSAEKITDVLSTLDGDNADVYADNLRIYREQLHRLDERISSLFEGIGKKKFIQWHPAWDFFAEDYGLQIVGTIEHGHGDEPSVKDFQTLIAKAKKEKVRTIVMGLNVESRTAQTLAREIDGRLIHLDSIGDAESEDRNSYLTLMEYNALRLSEALRK